MKSRQPALIPAWKRVLHSLQPGLSATAVQRTCELIFLNAIAKRKSAGLNRNGHSLLDVPLGPVCRCVRFVPIFIWALTAKRLQIERLELWIRYEPGIREKLLKRLGWPFVVKTSDGKHKFVRPPFSLKVRQIRTSSSRRSLVRRIRLLRHACGYSLANRGADTRLIHDYLGHKNIAGSSA
jgi:hypothetical protein